MTLDLIRVHDGGDTLEVGAFRLTKTALVVEGAPTIIEWEHCGHVLRRIEGAVQFWIGDWVNYGEKQYGDKYTDAIAATGFDYGTLRNHAWVANHVPLSSRDDKVDYSIHRAVASLPPDKQRELITRARDEQLTKSAVIELIRTDAHADKVAAIARGDLPSGEYDVVVADPPWAYDNSGFDQSAAEHYPTLTADAIAALPATDSTFPHFADPCVLFLWATSPLLPEAIRVVEAWGFGYKANLVWVKDRAPGIGWWLFTHHELLLVASRGSAIPLERVDSVITATVAAHSRKPDEAYTAIDRMFPGVRKVECFARTPRPGWDVWGNEV